MSTTDTRDTRDTRVRLLDAAEGLFADHGLDGTSLRAITSAANVNLASVNYHFGSKEGLIGAVFHRRIEPLNHERFRLLDLAEQAATPEPPGLEDVLHAFLAPPLRLRASSDPGGMHFACLMGRVFAEPNEVKMQALSQFRPMAERFAEVLGRILPDLPQTELLWRMHFLIGSLAHTIAAGDLICVLSSGTCDPDDVDGLLQRLTTYAAAGFRAPVADPVSRKESNLTP